MNIYYIDAENIGIGFFEETSISVLDRVFVFSNSDHLKSLCLNALITFVGGYPAGQNQADFYIIAHLSNVLAHLSKEEKKAITFLLCSKDQSLWKAFEFQCLLGGVKSKSPLIPPAITSSSVEPLQISIENSSGLQKPVVKPSVEQRILKCLSKPITVVEMQEKLKIQKSEFTSVFNILIKSGKIKRVDGSKKKWQLEKVT